MSTAYAIGGVSAVLQGILAQHLVDNAVSTAIGTDVTVSAVSPDTVDGDSRLNIFLYQVSPNTGWRNECLPSRNARAQRTNNQPLALDLHYLVSAHGTADLYSEIMLGSAMQALHETPFLERHEIRNLLSPPPLPDVDPILNALDASGLADQLEQIKVIPEYLSHEDMSKLWSALISSYRPSLTYVATVVLIEAEEPSVSALPVLTRDICSQSTVGPTNTDFTQCRV